MCKQGSAVLTPELKARRSLPEVVLPVVVAGDIQGHSEFCTDICCICTFHWPSRSYGLTNFMK